MPLLKISCIEAVSSLEHLKIRGIVMDYGMSLLVVIEQELAYAHTNQ